ncbi:MAG TPA: 30S ribosomal protein S20 [Anaeromyxobacteraceae bacterium]|nr:30S ribosomal protein S20 [Anaeromyxobacteraceae bacterium]
MANTRSAEKRNRQAQQRRLRNSAVRTRVKTAVKRFRDAIAAGDLAAAKTAFQGASRALDSAASKGVVHRNAASRRISRLARAVAHAAPAK